MGGPKLCLSPKGRTSIGPDGREDDTHAVDDGILRPPAARGRHGQDDLGGVPQCLSWHP